MQTIPFAVDLSVKPEVKAFLRKLDAFIFNSDNLL